MGENLEHKTRTSYAQMKIPAGIVNFPETVTFTQAIADELPMFFEMARQFPRTPTNK